MITLRNSDKFATIINKGDYGFTVNFGYTACKEDTCTGRKVFKTENAANKFANKYLN